MPGKSKGATKSVAVESLRGAFEELRDYGNDVSNATYRTVPLAIQRYVARLDREPLLSFCRETLPAVDFDVWYRQAESTFGGMVGSGKLNWPAAAPERVALQAELLRRIAREEIDLVTQFCYKFHWAGNHPDSNLDLFVKETFSPFHRDLVRLAQPALMKEADSAQTDTIRKKEPQGGVSGALVSEGRLKELRGLSSSKFDLRKVVRFCEELDTCYRDECFLAVASLTRALLDHVPPIFSVSSFGEVANNYRGGTRSFRASMQNLENSARKIGDAHLHTPIRKRETLPTSTQVNFANDLDVLLAEIVRVLS